MKKTKTELEMENEGLREELKTVVESMKICRYCKYLDADCSPSSPQCKPEWRGME